MQFHVKYADGSSDDIVVDSEPLVLASWFGVELVQKHPTMAAWARLLGVLASKIDSVVGIECLSSQDTSEHHCYEPQPVDRTPSMDKWLEGSPDDFVNPHMGTRCFLLEFGEGTRFVPVRYTTEGMISLEDDSRITDRPMRHCYIPDPAE